MQVDRRNYGFHNEVDNSEKHGVWKFPNSILTIQKPHTSKAFHPTEKPVALAEWLVKTYSNKGDTVLDSCMGVGWSAVASKALNRNFIGFDINPEYIGEAKKRIAAATTKLDLLMVQA